MKRDIAPFSGAMIIMIVILLTACGNKDVIPLKTTSEQIEVQLDSGGGIYALFYGETNLMGVTQTTYDYKGGYYLIGSCPQNGLAIDDENNVNSQTQQLGKILAVGETITANGNM